MPRRGEDLGDVLDTYQRTVKHSYIGDDDDGDLFNSLMTEKSWGLDDEESIISFDNEY